MAVQKLNEDLERISYYAGRNGLVLNPQKSKFKILGSKQQLHLIKTHKPDVRLDGGSIEQVTEARNLGVIMDEHLRFERHVTETVSNCFYRLKVLYRIRQHLSTDLRIHLCETLILSKLNYADTVVGERLLVRTKNLIQRVQNACARFCFTIPPRSHVTPYLNLGNLMNMKSRRELHFGCLLFGIMKSQTPPYLFEKLSFSQRHLRMASRLICPKHVTAAFRGSFRYAATKCWNNIPPPIRNCVSIHTFKRKYKAYLLKLQKELY